MYHHSLLLNRLPLLLRKNVHTSPHSSKKISHLLQAHGNCILAVNRQQLRCWSSTSHLRKTTKHTVDNGEGSGRITGTKEEIKHPIDNVVSSHSSQLMKSLPHTSQQYAQLARLDKPIGTMLLLWPCYWSTAIAAAAPQNELLTAAYTSFEISNVIGDPKLLALFATGSFLMRGAGCTINDMWDAKYDKKVKRTSERPLASGSLSYRQATAFLGVQLTGGLAVLTSLPHLEYCFWLGASSLPLVVAYPLMKRYTNWPQLVLGMTFNWGAFMGWAATHGSLDAHHGLSVVLPLYAGGVCWTLVYDTLYAHQDKEDDANLGLKSTALHFGRQTKPILFGFSVLATSSWALAGYNVGFEEPYYFIGCGAAGSHLIWQVATADLQDAKNLAERFKSNNTVGAILFASCVAGNISITAASGA